MSKQKFHKGDLVHVIADLGPMMSHFTSDIDAIVMYSYADEYGGSNIKDYCLHLKGKGKVSWYWENQLTLIESGRIDLLKTWEQERDAEIKQKSDLEWIFENGPNVVESPNGASLQSLADSLGLGSLWGDHGEGITYYIRSMQILEMATPFLLNKDKDGWLSIAEQEQP